MKSTNFSIQYNKTIQIVAIGLMFCWSLFQLSLPKLPVMDSIQIRSIHLAFALGLTYLTFPFWGKTRSKSLPSGILNCFLAIVAAGCALYIMLDWDGICERAGRPTSRDIAVGITLVVLLLEASRRVIGLALGVIAVLFTLYGFFGAHMPMFLAFRGISLNKYIHQITLSTEGIYGIPLDVSANTVFLFVLFGAILNSIGAGRFFNDLAIGLLGRYKGGPAKAAVVSSGFTGLVSGSSIANVVTTGTFTIPLMKKVGYPAKIAAATEVAASTNGQLMPPIMGAAAFIIAEYLNLPYMGVVKAAVIPAFVSYFALFYIVHLEARKLGMRGLSEEEIPSLRKTLKEGWHFFVPIGVLIYQLMIVRRTPNLSAFYSIISLVVVVFVKELGTTIIRREKIHPMFTKTLRALGVGMIEGAQNMISVAIACATAGIVVGVVTMGIGGMVVQIVETLAAGNLFLLLVITAVASLLLGMGLPTTATYIVMASITVPVILQLSAKLGFDPIPAIAAHLFCFYFGILADDTPPVGLAAYTASAIAGSNPISTGIQGFLYDLRTAVIPFMFILNPELLLCGIDSWATGLLIFAAAVFGAFAFSNVSQWWFISKLKAWEAILLLACSFVFFAPGSAAKMISLDLSYRYWLFVPALIVYAGISLWQRYSINSSRQAKA